MATTAMTAIVGTPWMHAVSKNYDGKADFEIRRLSNDFCSSSGIGSLQTTFKHEDKSYRTEPWRLFPTKRERAVVRSQKISSEAVARNEEKFFEADHGVHELVIVGAGIAGLSTAVAMHKIGVKSLVLEQSSALRITGSSLSLWRNAWHVLDVLGVGDQLRSMHSPVTSVRLLDKQGDLLRAFELDECPHGPHEVCGVERKLLAETLASVLPPSTIRFNARVISIKRESDVGPFELALSNGTVIRSKVLLGADGVNSVVAKWMGLPEARYAGYMGIRGLALYPDGHPYGTSLAQYMGSGSRAGVTPLSPTKIYWFFAYNKATPGPKVTDPNKVKEEIFGLFEGWPEFMFDILERTPIDSLSRSAISDRWNLPGSIPVVQNGVTLAGDALHPMTPNLGQGGCCALEDSIVLARTLGAVLGQGGNADYDSINTALQEYAAERRHRTLPLTIKSFVMGSLLQIPFPPVVFIRNKVAVPKLVSPNSFLSHTLYNPGQLPITRAVVNK